MIIFPYKNGSNSVKELKNSLGIKEIKREGSKFKGNPNKVVINWGASEVTPEVGKCKVANKPAAVALASNKLMFFNKVKDKVSIPEYTTDKSTALKWLEDDCTVVGREKLKGHSGEGIVIFEDVDQFNKYNKFINKSLLPLYVKYIPKKEEYRVHIVGGDVIDVRRKVVKNGINKKHVNWKVRSYNNGFIFQKNNINPDPKVIEEALKALFVVGLDFGAVDVIWNNFRKEAYVLEINTAPGLEGSTVEAYKEAFVKLFEHGHQKFDKFGKEKYDFDLIIQQAKINYFKYNLDGTNPPPQKKPAYTVHDEPAECVNIEVDGEEF